RRTTSVGATCAPRCGRLLQVPQRGGPPSWRAGRRRSRYSTIRVATEPGPKSVLNGRSSAHAQSQVAAVLMMYTPGVEGEVKVVLSSNVRSAVVDPRQWVNTPFIPT